MDEGKEEGTNSLPPQERRKADKHYGGSNVQDQGVARAEFVLSVICWEMTGDSWLLCLLLSHPQPVRACMRAYLCPKPFPLFKDSIFYYFAAISDHLPQLFCLLFI